jgi:hypothetical protein
VKLLGSGAEAGAWRALAAGGSSARAVAEGAALRFDFSLAGYGAWAIARREVDLVLPGHYVVELVLRGEASPCELQLKLVDPSGANVWWWRRRGFAPPRESGRLAFRRASLEFAWGPKSGGDPDRVGAIEIAVASDEGAGGTFWIEELAIQAREPAAELRACGVRASSSAAGHEPERALELDLHTCWRPAPNDPQPWLELDLGAPREWGGLAVCFAGDAVAPACRVLGSQDGARFEPLAAAEAGPGSRRWLRTGEAESRFVRLELSGAEGVARVAPVPIELAVSPARYAASLARRAPRGRFPRHLLGEHAYWALVGADGDLRKGLLGEDGALEVDAESFTLEPFVWDGGRLVSWADVASRVSLADGCLPIPTVEWEAGELRLAVTAFATGAPGASALVAHYTVSSRSAHPREVRLLVAIRPFQVTPSWQSLNLGGAAVAPITSLERRGARIRVNAARDVVAVTRPDGFGAAGSEAGLGALFLGRLPEAPSAEDPLGFAEGVLAFDLRLAAGAAETVTVAVPLFDASPAPPEGLASADAAAWSEARLADCAAYWRARLAPVPLTLPPGAAAFEQSLRASLAWILVNREGPRIQPGPRCYRRSWIRDGAMTGTALAEMGFAEEARAFLRWYAPHQLPDGSVPCAVDRHGLDRAVEHDSHGELVWGIVEVFRLTGDGDFLRALWPHALRAVEAIERLRSQRTTPEWRGDPRFGLLPESISHEGYASQPAHSYWDDFFALRALADAADAAAWLGDAEAQARSAALRDALRRDLHASIALSMRQHGVDFVPGAAELGDFDPTSTAIAFDPCGEGERLPRAPLERTFERYWEQLEARRRGAETGDAYTPYEIRNAVALLRLGWKERALALLAWLIEDQRPTGLRQWPEVSTRDPRAPRFLGDLPHGWVASSYVRALRRLVAYERDADGALVVAAGIPEAWVLEAPGVRVRGLPTHFGVLDLELFARGPDAVVARLGGSCRPPGGLVIESPLPRPLREVAIDGRAVPAADPARVALRDVPGEVILRYAPAGGVSRAAP